MAIRLLVFEDTENKLKSFKTFLEIKLTTELNLDLEIENREDDSTLEQDLMTNNFDLILIDDDLGDIWGNEIIENIIAITDSTPEVQNVPKIYYSAGTPVNELRNKINHLGGNIPCIRFDELVDYVFNLIESMQ